MMRYGDYHALLAANEFVNVGYGFIKPDPIHCAGLDEAMMIHLRRNGSPSSEVSEIVARRFTGNVFLAKGKFHILPDNLP
jgi:hypothetical protein